MKREVMRSAHPHVLAGQTLDTPKVPSGQFWARPHRCHTSSRITGESGKPTVTSQIHGSGKEAAATQIELKLVESRPEVCFIRNRVDQSHGFDWVVAA
jgi:hypothetical protein